MNILMIYADEFRADVLDEQVTPNLHELASRSVSFGCCHTPCPICVPSRAALATGRYPRSNGCLDNAMPALPGESARSLYRRFAEAGWTVENVGKYALPWPLAESGFSYHEDRDDGVSPFGPVDRELRRAASMRRLDGDLPIVISGEYPLPPEQCKTALVVDLAIDRLRAHARDDRVFLRVALNQPHTPYAAPGPYARAFDPEDVALPSSWCDDPRSKPTLVQLFYANRRYRELTEDDYRCCRASYLGLVQYIDAELGRLQNAAAECWGTDNTIIVFTSDHGTCLGEHGWIEKWAQLWDETCRVPLLLSIPGTEPARCAALVSQMDLMPTLCELCGIAPPDEVHARSLAPLLTSPDKPFRDALFSETFIPGLMTEPACAVRTERWKLTDYPRMADVELRLPVDHPRNMHPMFDPENLVEGELYDLQADPEERANLIASPEHADAREQLRALLDDWRASCEPAVAWEDYTPPYGFRWSQQRLVEGSSLRDLATVWGGQRVAPRRRGEPRVTKGDR